MADEETYPGGLAGLQKLTRKRRRPFHGYEDVLPAENQDLLPFLTDPTPPPGPVDVTPGHISHRAGQIATEFEGRPKILWLHAVCIAITRHDDPPAIAGRLFRRIWLEHGEFMLEHLSVRWKISAIATFRDVGATESERRIGMALAIFLNLTKLHETERTYSQTQPGRPYTLADRAKGNIALDMGVFTFPNGDLDLNLMHYLWEEAALSDPIIRPLALDLLQSFNKDNRTVFRRLRKMRQKFLHRQAKRKENK